MLSPIIDRQLAESVRAVINAGEIVEVRKGSNAWRIVANFRSDFPDRDRLIKLYYIWFSNEYIHTYNIKPVRKELANAALEVIQERFRQSDNAVPIEDGISVLDRDNKIMVDPKSYIHPEERV